MKKILSLVLVLSMVLGSFGMAFAAPVDVEGTEYESAVEKLVALGVIDGYEDGTFRPERTITRAEFAKLVVVASGLEAAAAFAGYESQFEDVKANDWFNGYVNVATSQGMIQGYPDGTFRPQNPVTYAEAVTILVRALGYSDETVTGTWPTNYIVRATSLGVTKDVTVRAAAAIRGDVAKLLDNTLFVEMVDAEAKGLDKTLVEGLVDETDEEYTIVEIVEDGVKAKGVADVVETAIDLEAYLGETVVTYTKDGVIVYVSEVTSDSMTITVEEFDAATAEDAGTVTYDEDEDALTFELDTLAVWNGVAMTMAEVQGMDNFEGATIKVVYDEDDEITFVVGSSYQAPVLVADDYEYDEDTVVADFDTMGIELVTDEDDDEEVVIETVVTGVVNDIADIEAYDVLYVKANAEFEAIEILVVRDAVTGVVEEVKSKSLVVDGVEIKFGDDLVGTPQPSGLDEDDNPVNQYVILDIEGKVHAVVAVPGEEAVEADEVVAVVLGTDTIEEVKNFGQVVEEEKLLVKLYVDGEEKVLEVTDNGFDEGAEGAEGAVVKYEDKAVEGKYTLELAADDDVAAYTLRDATVAYVIEEEDGKYEVTKTTYGNLDAYTLVYFVAEDDGFKDVLAVYVTDATLKADEDTTDIALVVAKSTIVGGEFRYTVLENGVATTYTTDGQVELTVGEFYELELTDGKITDSTEVADAVTVLSGKVVAIDSTRIRVEGEAIQDFADEVVVYDLREDDEYEVAKLADVKVDKVVVDIFVDGDEVTTVVITADVE